MGSRRLLTPSQLKHTLAGSPGPKERRCYLTSQLNLRSVRFGSQRQSDGGTIADRAGSLWGDDGYAHPSMWASFQTEVLGSSPYGLRKPIRPANHPPAVSINLSITWALPSKSLVVYWCKQDITLIYLWQKFHELEQKPANLCCLDCQFTF